jgi:hypothetical protein
VNSGNKIPEIMSLKQYSYTSRSWEYHVKSGKLLNDHLPSLKTKL